jgi:hypothetical protein
MSQAYRDPTFDAVAARERKDCTQCAYITRLWGLVYCEKKKWAGEKNMRRCDGWTFRERRV